MQFKIPQNVQMEDKIVGPLTLKQLTIVGVGGGITYFIYISLSKIYILTISVLFSAPIALFTLAVAFLKIHGMTFIQYVLSAMEFYFLPRQRLWTQGAGEIFVSITQPTLKTKDQLRQEKQQTKSVKNVQSVQDIAKSVDSYSQLLKQE